jgi:prevent-host-death family protein
MPTYSLSDARAHLALILNKVEDGEEITITRHGRPAAVIVGHDRWMKTKRHDVLEQARELRAELEAKKDHPLPDFPTDPSYDVEGHIAWLRESDDPWDEIAADDERNPRNDD